MYLVCLTAWMAPGKLEPSAWLGYPFLFCVCITRACDYDKKRGSPMSGWCDAKPHVDGVVAFHV
jgi:hypothetical protein